ncbi:histidine kinase [Streptomyces sp. S07_1.15]|uniref:sensor histidine kinase n=1 Tax=Streptomyces sp. S07_1.15 TaxID=2873925 RepID=UPI001D13E121|nr:histidine kinase [Streptomyces sp. S07_1.15]MCC3654471.1 histidine kinase [Streptomyces sp. S07_1.15]
MGKFRDALRAAGRGLYVAVVSLAGSIALLVLSVLSIGFISLGVGVLTTPVVLGAVRSFAEWRRRLGYDWAGVRTPSAYRPLPADLRPGLAGQAERCARLLRDPATWRDLLWLPVDMTAGFFTAALPAVLLAFAAEGVAIAAGLWRVLGDGYWFAFIPVRGQVSALAAGALGLLVLAGALRVNPALLQAHFRLTGAVLAPSKEALARRVERLSETRHDAVDTSAAELRRIERDLHDGAQARLVAMGMSLGTVEALLEKDPEQARKLLAAARQDSAEALTELRDLVRGIHPPVLAERGLGDAVRALALRMPLPVEVEVDLPGRFAAPVESAAYFAVSEVLTNAVKHSGAERVWLDVHHDAASGTLRMTVTDNGRGGADPSAGSGLAGIERRLGTFDGILAVSSPAGGPTLVTMELPCVLSSQKTSSS